MQEKIAALENEYANKHRTLEENFELETKKLKQTRERETEEYNYKTKRERELDNNAWADEKKKREAQIAQKEEETAKLNAEAKKNEAYVKELETKINSLPDMLDKEYQKGRKEMASEIEKDNKYQIELLKKDFTNTIDRQNDQIESLHKEMANYLEMNKVLQEKLDKAYSEIKDMATKTVEAGGGVKILNNGENNKN